MARVLSLFLAIAVAGCGGRRDGGRTDAGGGGIDGGEIDAGDAIDAGAIDAAGDPDAGSPDDAGPEDGGATCDPTVALPFPDEAPGTDRTEPPSCTSCPSFSGVSATPAGTTASVSGMVLGDATSCRWYLLSPTCGGASGAFAPSEFTTFTLRLPLFCGTNRLELVCDGPAGRAISTRDIAGPACASRDLQVTLAWGATAFDMELHLVRAGAHINDPVGDCTWFTCMSSSPDWGVIGDTSDDPRKDVDNTGFYGPENIFLTSAGDGRYDVMVEYWAAGTTDTSEVSITLGGVTVWRGTRAMDVHDVWHVGTLEFPAETFTPVDTLIPCSGSWQTGGSRGCALAIP